MLGHRGITFVPQAPYKEMDEDTMKSLCLEMLHKQKYGEIYAVTEGRLPTEKELNQMAGERLNDPWSSNPHKPRYAKDNNNRARRMDTLPAAELSDDRASAGAWFCRAAASHGGPGARRQPGPRSFLLMGGKHMQSASQSHSTQTICRHCGGKKYVMKGSERRTQVKQFCYHCRGTGKVSSGYKTK